MSEYDVPPLPHDELFYRLTPCMVPSFSMLNLFWIRLCSTKVTEQFEKMNKRLQELYAPFLTEEPCDDPVIEDIREFVREMRDAEAIGELHEYLPDIHEKFGKFAVVHFNARFQRVQIVKWVGNGCSALSLDDGLKINIHLTKMLPLLPCVAKYPPSIALCYLTDIRPPGGQVTWSDYSNRVFQYLIQRQPCWIMLMKEPKPEYAGYPVYLYWPNSKPLSTLLCDYNAAAKVNEEDE